MTRNTEENAFAAQTRVFIHEQRGYGYDYRERERREVVRGKLA